MRRIVVLIMGFFGLLTIIGGIIENHSGPPVFHISIATIFFILSLVHIWFNRKVILRYVKIRK